MSRAQQWAGVLDACFVQQPAVSPTMENRKLTATAVLMYPSCSMLEGANPSLPCIRLLPGPPVTDRHVVCGRVIAQSMGNDKSFQNVLNNAFEHFINLSQRTPEYISLFMDDRLRRGVKGASDEDVEATLDKVMMLFRYLAEKDVFEKYYKQHLAKRLLSGRAVSRLPRSASRRLLYCWDALSS